MTAKSHCSVYLKYKGKRDGIQPSLFPFIDVKSIDSLLNIESLGQRFLQWNLHDFQQ